jgi:hypothetical protein
MHALIHHAHTQTLFLSHTKAPPLPRAHSTSLRPASRAGEEEAHNDTDEDEEVERVDDDVDLEEDEQVRVEVPVDGVTLAEARPGYEIRGITPIHQYCKRARGERDTSAVTCERQTGTGERELNLPGENAPDGDGEADHAGDNGEAGGARA